MLGRQIKKMDVISIRGLNEMKVIIFIISKDKQNNYIRPQLIINLYLIFLNLKKESFAAEHILSAWT